MSEPAQPGQAALVEFDLRVKAEARVRELERERNEYHENNELLRERAERAERERDTAVDSTMHQENYDAACLRADEAEARAQKAEATNARLLESHNELADALVKAEAVVEAARELKLDAGVDDIDSRLSYVMIQTDRRTWQEFIAALTAYDEPHAPVANTSTDTSGVTGFPGHPYPVDEQEQA